MARKSDIQYVRFYTDGSAARKLAPVAPLKTIKLPKPKSKKRRIVHIDPLAFAGILMAAVMLIMMAVGIGQLNTARQEMQMMDNYVQTLTGENQQLQKTFEESYDLEQLEKTALALGLVPENQVKHITVQLPPVQQTEEPSTWEQICTFLTGLFA